VPSRSSRSPVRFASRVSIGSSSGSWRVSDRGPLSAPAKATLALRILHSYLRIRPRVHREPLPPFIAMLGRPGRRTGRPLPPQRLSRAVYRTLRLGPRRPTCLVNALVLYRLLREQGDDAEVVIGLPAAAADKDAHAWVELQGVDIGPPPGRSGHAEMARFS
jgi:hypothetical protein